MPTEWRIRCVVQRNSFAQKMRSLNLISNLKENGNPNDNRRKWIIILYPQNTDMRYEQANWCSLLESQGVHQHAKLWNTKSTNVSVLSNMNIELE